MLKSICFALHLCSSISGNAYVIDADTLVIDGRHIRLHGIDGPELSEPFGQVAKIGLVDIVSNRTIECVWTGKMSYKRYVAVCYLSDGTDIGMMMVQKGLVLDCARYSLGFYRKYEPTYVRTMLRQKPYC